MKSSCNVLIIDDHQMIIEGYKNALLLNNVFNGDLYIDFANNCEIAYETLFQSGKTFDIVFLDISLPISEVYKIYSGEDLGVKINEMLPETKIIVITSYNDYHRLNNILVNINPMGFLLKCDICSIDIIDAFKSILIGVPYYSKTILAFIRQKMSSNIVLDNYDIQILYEISNGSRMKELEQLIPLTKSAIDKRKRLLRKKLNISGDSDRDLVLVAKMKGFI